MPLVVNYDFMISSSKRSPVGEGGSRRTQNGCWEMAAGAELRYCMWSESRGCLFSTYSALHHLCSANPLAAVRTTDHAVSLTSAWITENRVCMCVCEREREDDVYPTIWNLVKYSLTIIPLWPRSWMMPLQRESEGVRERNWEGKCVFERKRVSVRDESKE